MFGILTSLLSFVCWYQIGYFTKGLISMGWAYFTLFKVLGQVLIIVPGLVLGVHTTTKLFDPTKQSHKAFTWISIAYLVIAILEVVFYVVAASKLPVH